MKRTPTSYLKSLGGKRPMVGIHQLTIPEEFLHLVITDFIFVFNILDEQNSVFFCVYIYKFLSKKEDG